MKRFLLSAFFLNFCLISSAQITVFEDSFESYTDFAINNVGSWTLTDMDNAQYSYGIQISQTQNVNFPNTGAVKSFIVFNPNSTNPSLGSVPEYQAKSGNKYMAAFASFNDVGGQASPVTQSDWLISPKMTLGTGNVVKFWANQITDQYGNERFRVLISDGNNTTTNFTALSQGNYIQLSGTNWTEYTYNIPASYDLKDVYVAIQCVSNDSFIFMVDDFKVTAQTLSTENFFKSNFAIYPNPVNDILNIESKNGLTVNEITVSDLSGKVVATVKNAYAINVSNLAPGTYIVNIDSNDGRATSKFVKK